MSIFVIGINYKTASIALREKAYFALDKLALYLQDLMAQGVANEAVLISTCNRTELYCDSENQAAPYKWLCEQIALPQDELNNIIYVYQNEQAIAHIMAVASGLDSMVLGEPEILGQMKEAYSEACTAGTVNALFHRLFQHIFSVAKEIRTTTAIGACPVSVASTAVRFVKQQLSQFLKDLVFEQANVLLIGAGDTSALLMRYLQPLLKTPVTLVNRSLDNAAQLVDEFGGSVFHLDKLPDALKRADIVFSATGSAHPLVTKDMMVRVMQERAHAPIMIVDIAVPRDVDRLVAELENVKLFCIDDLKQSIETNRQGREHAADKARELINKKCRLIFQELQSVDKVAHTIRAYRGQIEDICRAELLKAKQQLSQGADPALVLDLFAHAFINKLLHSPSVQLRQAGAEGRFELLKLAKQLFAIPDPDLEVERL